MNAIKQQVIEGKRYCLTPCKGIDPCKGCVGWDALTASGNNLCTALGEDCVDEEYVGTHWVADPSYVASVPVKPVTIEELDALEW